MNQLLKQHKLLKKETAQIKKSLELQKARSVDKKGNKFERRVL